MAEKKYIERDLILDTMAKYFSKANDSEEQATIDIWKGIKKIPAADVVEVVRCEHCKHSWFNGVSLWLCQREANSYCPTVKADAFCSYGERKDQDNV